MKTWCASGSKHSPGRGSEPVHPVRTRPKRRVQCRRTSPTQRGGSAPAAPDPASPCRRGSAGDLVRPLRGLSRSVVDALQEDSAGMKSGFFGIGRDFPWTVPVGHAVLLLIPGMVVAAVSRLRPGLVSMRSGSWLLATLAIWAALLRLPLYGVCSLLLAAGLGRPISDAVASRVLGSADGAIHAGGAPRPAGCPGGSLVGTAGDP